MAKSLKGRSKKTNFGSLMSMKLLGGLKKMTLASLPYILCLSLVGALFGGVIAYAMNSPTFRLEEVKILNMGTVPPAEAFRFCELQKGENMITLDLVGIQQVIKRSHPEFKEVRVRRVLPNRIDVLLKRRTPIAQLLFSRYVQIDRNLVILPGSSPVPFRNLTIIEGTPIPREGLFIGVTVRDDLTKKALKLADLIKNSRILGSHVLTKVDIADPKNLSLFVDQDIEVRIGNSAFADRLKILAETLKKKGLDRSKIRYIDLRFDDVVIGPR